MKKYNLHEIMNNAWHYYSVEKSAQAMRKYHGLVSNEKINFADCLKKAWNYAKEVIKEAEEKAKRAAEAAKRIAAEEAQKIAAGVVRMHYSQYKNEYSNCQTVEGSYDKKTKTIEVMTKVARVFERRPSVTAIRGLCPRCHTYCYGDCMAR